MLIFNILGLFHNFEYAKTPGSDWVNANISMKSSLLIHLFFTISRSMRGIIAYPPPIVNIPILAKVIKSSKYFIISLRVTFFCKETQINQHIQIRGIIFIY